MDWSIIVASPPSALQLVVLTLSAVLTVDAIQRFIRNRIKRNGYSLPPGPTPLPLLGSALSINAQAPWLTYTVWRKKYGDIMYARLLDNDVIVLSSYSDTIELLDKRSRLYSDRPFIATTEPYGHGEDISITFARYGSHWRLSRRIIHQTFRAEEARTFRPIQLLRARQMVISIMDDNDAYPSHFSTYSSALAMSVIYDYEPKARDDPIIKLINDFLEASLPALTPEMAVLLKACPFLLNVPEWIPGLSRIRHEASKSYTLGMKAVLTPYSLVQKRMAAEENVVANTMVFDHLQRMKGLDNSHRIEYERALKTASISSFLGSAETTSAILLTFTLAMVQNPRIWRHAQAEIDSLTRTQRLPEFGDRPSLPYVEAIVRESLRWCPVVPLGVPHAVTTDDIYKGYFIPRGATVFANIWGMSRDEIRYPNPDAFVPERFLNPDGTLKDDNPADYVFGFGRRRCPGRHVGDASVWSGIVTLLATVDFHAIKDENGNDIEFEAKFVNGVTHHPASFPCNLMPRAHITREALQDL